MRSILLFLLLSLIQIRVVTAINKEEGIETSTKETPSVEADPDTKCSNVYRKTPTKEVCLSTKDFFMRPCCFCVDKKGNDFCYNQDEAKWASIFGDKCEYRPDDDSATKAQERVQ